MKMELRKLAQQYRLTAIYAFGSRAKEIAALLAGEEASGQSQESDVDIGVLPEQDRRLTADDRVRIMLRLEDILNVARIDLVILPEASPFLALEVVRGELLLTTNEDAEAEFQLYVLRRAGDLAGWEIERRRMLLAGEAI